MLQLDEPRLRQFLREVQERRRAVVAFREGRVELKQRALEKTGLRSDLAIGQNLERAPHDWKGLGDRSGRCHARLRAAARNCLPHEVLVSDELVAVALKDDAGECPSADHENL